MRTEKIKHGFIDTLLMDTYLHYWIPMFTDIESAKAAGLQKGDLYVDKVTHALTIVGKDEKK